jgi:hypothetical protein
MEKGSVKIMTRMKKVLDQRCKDKRRDLCRFSDKGAYKLEEF